MQRFLLPLAVCVLLFTAGAQAQEAPSRFQKQHFKRTLTMLIQNLESGHTDIQVSSVQAIREMQMEFPDESFDRLMKPLTTVLKDENGDTILRLLSAMALDAMHTDEGDSLITQLSQSSSNKSLQDQCKALSVKGLH
jgi:hypothetical protein